MAASRLVFLLTCLTLLISPSSAQTCSDSLASCETTLNNVTAQLQNLTAAYSACNCGFDPCAYIEAPDYSLGLHVAAVFIILFASFLGSLSPLSGKYIPLLKVHPLVIVYGKCIGTGIILACALVHMLQPAAQSLASTCLPPLLNPNDYSAYAYLFAMLSGLCMHFLDYNVQRYYEKKIHGKQTASISMEKQDKGDDSKDLEACPQPDPNDGHAHGVLFLDPHAQKTIEAYMLEFGVTVHSVFIGLAVGVVGDTELRALIVALFFHQFFEGVALGARIVDANLPTRLHEALLCLVFSIAAPLGIGMGIAVAQNVDPNGVTYTTVEGIFDSCCAGILIYIGYSLLQNDFHHDMRKNCTGKKYESILRAGMFVCLWGGAGLMAYIGKYL